MKTTHKLFILGIGIMLFTNCKKTEESIPVAETGKLKINFTHTVDGQAVQLNSNIYINEAGNHYEVNDIMYFISDVKLHPHIGNQYLIDNNIIAHYVDINIPSTLNWIVNNPIPAGVYDSISFIFGINEQHNKSNVFTNSPESNMFWPDILGGGYHYMKINGKWINPQNTSVNFNFHHGIGQIYTDTINYNVNTITAYIQNYFKVTLSLSPLQIVNNTTSTIILNMAINSWFKTPHTWDHNYWGGSIMQKQRAQQVIKENGIDVFSIQ